MLVEACDMQWHVLAPWRIMADPDDAAEQLGIAAVALIGLPPR